jgi:hypothetical protein
VLQNVPKASGFKALSSLKSSTPQKPSSPIKEKSPSKIKTSPKKKVASSTAKSIEAQEDDDDDDEEPELQNKVEKSVGPKSKEFVEESDSDSDSESETSESNDTIPISPSKKLVPTVSVSSNLLEMFFRLLFKLS